jgi:hypothetical protein
MEVAQFGMHMGICFRYFYMVHGVYCQAFYLVITFTSCIHQAKLNLCSGNPARVAISYWHYLDGGDLRY